MTITEIIHKAFDIWCMDVYSRTYPYTDNNLLACLKEIHSNTYNEIDEINLEIHLNADVGSYFGEELQKYIQENEHRTDNT